MTTVYIVDTNVVVSGVMASDLDSPPARIVDAMLDGGFLYSLSPELLHEYAGILRRSRIARIHGWTDEQLDRFLTDLTDLVANSVWRDPAATDTAPDSGDNHLWAPLAAHRQACLVTGDQLLVSNPRPHSRVVTPRQFLEEFLIPRSAGPQP
ncbi:MAG: PIN domain-containing protein [Gammaproteobacteria bacterium]|nr:PIN domain-containing protein [Gammaproteobacteria bacterium]MDE0441636.1 PIN domain-containing protein [Gammaproteobacteria bacterium]